MTWLAAAALVVLLAAGVLCLVHGVAVALDTFARDRDPS